MEIQNQHIELLMAQEYRLEEGKSDEQADDTSLVRRALVRQQGTVRAGNRKALDDHQDRRVVKVIDAVEKKFDWGEKQKSGVLENIRDLTNVKRARED